MSWISISSFLHVSTGLSQRHWKLKLSLDEIISVFPTHQSDLLQCFLTYISLIHWVAQVRNLDGETLKVALSLIPPCCWRGNSVDPICSTSMWLLRAKCRPSALFPCITTIVRCLQSGLPWIQPSQQCHCNLLKNVKLILLLCCLKAFIGCLLDKVLKSLSGC